MLIWKKRHDSELADAVAKVTRLNEEILGGLPEAIFMLDRDNLIRAPISRSMETLFRRRDLRNMRFEEFLQSVVSEKVCAAALDFLRKARAGDALADLKAGNPLHDVEARIPTQDGAAETKLLNFAFRRIISVGDPHQMIVAVSDATQRVELTRELEELRAYSKIQSACLSALTRVGSERFAAFLRQSDASMNLINAALKKPARETAAFRAKLEEILQEIVQLKAEAGLLELHDIESRARTFEESLVNLKKAEILTGTDFLPLAVRLDELFAQLALMRNMINASRGAARAEPPVSFEKAHNGSRMSDNGTEIIEPAKLAALLAQAKEAIPSASRHAPSGGLESTLQSMTEHVAQSQQKKVALICDGLADVPVAYQGLVKNIAIQLIRNAVVHGIETPEERKAAGKPAAGRLTLKFTRCEDRSFHLSFGDDGRGLDSELLRRIAVVRGLITPEAAERLTHRQAIKLIFKKGFSTVEEPGDDGSRGMGMTLVRRYVSDAGGHVGLASEPGKHTRFRVALPPLEGAQDESQVA
jgi:two-component system chemotaxis sensor kinase CheA